jgi:hypothetical protein
MYEPVVISHKCYRAFGLLRSVALHAMSTKTIRCLIVATIVLQFFWSMILPAGNRLAPKSPEMAQALRAFETNRSAATEAAMWEQVRRDEARVTRRDEAIFGFMLLTDAVAICLFWNYGLKKIPPDNLMK